MTRHRVGGLLAVAGVAAVLLSACSGATDKLTGDSAGEPKTKVDSTVDSKALTKPGATLERSDHAVLGTTGQLDGSDEMVVTRAYDVAISLRKGARADLSQVQLTGAAATATPYYVTLRVTKNSGTKHTGTFGFDDNDFHLMASDGKDAQGIKIVAGDIEACPEGDTLNSPTFEDKINSGKTVRSCRIFMVGKGLTAKSFLYQTRTGYYAEDGVSWQLG